MLRAMAAGLAALLVLSGCEPSGSSATGSYNLRAGNTSSVQQNVLESVNFMRQSAGVAPVQLSRELNSAAQSQAVDISRQKRAWAWGSNWSSPYQRVARAGYSGRLVGELYSQSFDTELETLTVWLADRDKAAMINDPDATDIGFAYHQDSNGMTWWVLTLGSRGDQ
ncbi:CAP domain-containing protein [Poseidonocella sp. HB161398]|uniref:CAP domain-containing protein n=1 Tax=Poseidonocella sp. HB161398 TaxID=2320855 RepID=UPI001108619E|nr:CAP domain-containing protein [Poseidonocella sp. HB161398]